jgi:hypothetical protein
LHSLWFLLLRIELFLLRLVDLRAKDQDLTSLVLLKVIIFVELVHWLFWLVLILVLLNLLLYLRLIRFGEKLVKGDIDLNG